MRFTLFTFVLIAALILVSAKPGKDESKRKSRTHGHMMGGHMGGGKKPGYGKPPGQGGQGVGNGNGNGNGQGNGEGQASFMEAAQAFANWQAANGGGGWFPGRPRPGSGMSAFAG